MNVQWAGQSISMFHRILITSGSGTNLALGHINPVRSLLNMRFKSNTAQCEGGLAMCLYRWYGHTWHVTRVATSAMQNGPRHLQSRTEWEAALQKKDTAVTKGTANEIQVQTQLKILDTSV